MCKLAMGAADQCARMWNPWVFLQTSYAKMNMLTKACTFEHQTRANKK